MDAVSGSSTPAADQPGLPDLIAALPPRLGGRGQPGRSHDDPRSVAVTYMMQANARLLRPQLSDEPAMELSSVRGLGELQANWATVRAEWDALRSSYDRLPTMERILGGPPGWDGSWEWFSINSFSRWEPRARAAVPATVELLEGVEGLVQAAFSILKPGTFLHPHRGTNTGVLRGLMGIVVPEPEACGTLVGDCRMDLSEGVMELFDDTFEHAAWNAGTTERVALLLEIRHPARGLPDRFNRLCQRAYRHHAVVQKGIERLEPLMLELEES